MAGQVADEPTIVADSGQTKVPFLLRRAGETRVLLSPLTLEQVRERFALYRGDGKRRDALARVQGRVVVAVRTSGHMQMNSYRQYLRGVLTSAYCVPRETPEGTRVLMTLSSMRYRRVYTVGLLLTGIVGILIFAPANALWMRALLAFGILLIASNWRLSRPTRSTIEEKRFLAEFVRNLLEAEDISRSRQQRPTEREAVPVSRGRLG